MADCHLIQKCMIEEAMLLLLSYSSMAATKPLEVVRAACSVAILEAELWNWRLGLRPSRPMPMPLPLPARASGVMGAMAWWPSCCKGSNGGQGAACFWGMLVVVKGAGVGEQGAGGGWPRFLGSGVGISEWM